MKIALIGMSGCFKTSAGKVVAEHLNLEFCDLDSLIEYESGHKISEIFSKYGESRFRDLESKTLEKICTKDNILIATGGGVILDAQNMVLLKNYTKIWLNSDVGAIYSRLKDDDTRPLLNKDKYNSLQQIYNQRVDIYSKYANITINNSELDAAQTVESIIEILKKLQQL